MIPEWGRIPWSLDELGATLARAAELHEIPHDDWDRAERGVTMREADGSTSRIVFNPDRLENQIMHWLHSRWHDQGLDEQTRMAHSWRLFEALAFLSTNKDRLLLEGLVMTDPDQPERAGISSGLVRALAESPYEGVKLDFGTGDPVPTFHIDRVIEMAQRFDDVSEDESD